MPRIRAFAIGRHLRHGMFRSAVSAHPGRGILAQHTSDINNGATSFFEGLHLHLEAVGQPDNFDI
jgi:hypothetical protein